MTQDELELAARGAFVTRVIYIEDPQQALPISRKANDEQPWVEAPAGEDPLVTADRQGRPVAILRIGGRVPSATDTANGGQCVPRFVTFDPAAACANDVAEPITFAAVTPSMADSAQHRCSDAPRRAFARLVAVPAHCGGDGHSVRVQRDR